MYLDLTIEIMTIISNISLNNKEPIKQIRNLDEM